MANRGGTTGAAPESGSNLRTFIYVIGGLLTGGMLWLLIADTFTAANINAKCFDVDTLCCAQWDSGRERAEHIGASFARDWSIMLSQTNHAKHEFVEKFAHHKGVYSTVDGNNVGRIDIMTALQQYVDTTRDLHVTIRIHRFSWDSETYTLTIEWEWSADADEDTHYVQDQAIEIRFDCEFKVVFYRGYWDSTQQYSTYTRRYTHACDTCRRESEHHHDEPESLPPHTEEPHPNNAQPQGMVDGASDTTGNTVSGVPPGSLVASRLLPRGGSGSSSGVTPGTSSQSQSRQVQGNRKPAVVAEDVTRDEVNRR